MKIPYTIPELVLRTYTRKQTDEEIKKSYEGRALRAEDFDWDSEYCDNSLASLALKKIIENFQHYVEFNEETNKINKINFEVSLENWVADGARVAQEKIDFENKIKQRGKKTIDPFDPDFDPFDPHFEFELREPDDFTLERPNYIELPPLLNQLNFENVVTVLDEVDPDSITIECALRTIPDGRYWERLCSTFFPECFVEDYSGSYKKLYVEKTLRDKIESFHPFDSNPKILNEELERYGPYATGLNLQNLIPVCYGVPRKPPVVELHEADDEMFGEEDEGFDENPYMIKKKAEEAEIKAREKAERLRMEQEDEEVIIPNDEAKAKANSPSPKTRYSLRASETDEERLTMTRDNSHIDMSIVLPKLFQLTELKLIYQMVEMGVEYEERFFDFTLKDCRSLAKGISECPTLKVFELIRSKLDGRKIKILIREGLIKLPNLESLDFSYNQIGDKGAKALARLLSDETSTCQKTLRRLILPSNNILRKGAKAIAYGLSVAQELRVLNLNLNPIHETGGKAIANALVEHDHMTFLSLASTYIGDGTCKILGKMLHHNTHLREFDISNNMHINEIGAESILYGVVHNKRIIGVNISLTNSPPGIVSSLRFYIRLNRRRYPNWIKLRAY